MPSRDTGTDRGSTSGPDPSQIQTRFIAFPRVHRHHQRRLRQSNIKQRHEKASSQREPRSPPPRGQAIPRRPMISLRSSASTPFMLAALRVLHVDTSHTPASDAVIGEGPYLETYQLALLADGGRIAPAGPSDRTSSSC